ncbi:protein Wnt-8a-like [Scleropages formosus]|uniref:protein Wnt-8a-like n=1 Tax=Scleropages formosus TaxID=113540 RepID=UPI000878E09F|nr:protein Wnt-8a-like [Scleropages formosus]XP_018611863.1 protein Wnt-8a-like [Scleropages formosus]
MGPCQMLTCLLFSISHVLSSKAWLVNNFLLTGPKAFLAYTSSVQAGAQKGIEECKYQFAWDRWNCPESALQLSTHNGIRGATRETSFVHAISSAGVMHTLTRNCSMGDFASCGCDDSRIGQMGGKGWVWGGCSDNVDFGENISKQFLDALETGRDARAAVNLHNNEVGRLAIRATMKRSCKCHGISGSCSVQTCWLQLANFREVGNYLKVKHVQALKMEMDKRRIRTGNSAVSRGTIANTFKDIARTELIYLEDSPDYCVKNSTLGLQGTEGRECLQGGKNLSQWERRSCRRLCHECGLKVEERRTEAVNTCKCKFYWCCTVQCDVCTEVVTKRYCARRTHADKGSARRRQRQLKS